MQLNMNRSISPTACISLNLVRPLALKLGAIRNADRVKLTKAVCPITQTEYIVTRASYIHSRSVGICRFIDYDFSIALPAPYPHWFGKTRCAKYLWKNELYALFDELLIGHNSYVYADADFV
jgi:hypothetical protein